MSRHLISTQATPTNCPRCRARILTAIDEGTPAHVDATPVDRNGEIDALCDGRRTYTHTRWGELAHRDPGRIQSGKPAGPVHAEHVCPPQPPTLF